MKTHRIKLPPSASLALIAAVTMTSVFFFNATAYASDGDRAQALKTAELARFAAQVSADTKALGLLLDDQLEYVHSNGDLDTKASFVQSLVSGKRDYVSTTANILNVRILGDVGIIRGTAKVTVATNGASQDIDLGYTDVWVWKDHRWQMTSWRSARYPTPAK